MNILTELFKYIEIRLSSTRGVTWASVLAAALVVWIVVWVITLAVMWSIVVFGSPWGIEVIG